MSLHYDPVRLVLGGEDLAIVESYEIREGILNQPSSFAIRLGNAAVTRELLAKYPPNTQFQLYIGAAPIQYGFTDGPDTGDAGGATLVNFEGRDLGARIHDAYVSADLSFPADTTFTELLRIALKAVGLPDAFIHPDNNANRKSHVGKTIVATAPTIEETTLEDGSAGPQQIVPGTTRTVFQTVTAKFGTRWGEFLKTQFDHGGIFWWADCSGGFVITAPNPNQEPVYRIVRKRGQSESANVLGHKFRNNIGRRFTKCIVAGHGGGRNFGRSKNHGEWIDAEMAALLGGDDVKTLQVHDPKARDPKAAAAMARRKIAEANRNGWQLNYKMAGHSAPSLTGGGDARAIWTPDTMVEVDDDELGIHGLFYVEAVTHTRLRKTESTVHLMRPQDLIFADPGSEPT